MKRAKPDGYHRCECCGVDIVGEFFCEACTLCGCTQDECECRMCLIDGARGIYVPQAWAQMFGDMESSPPVSTTQLAILNAGPEHEEYWDVWDEIVDCTEYDAHGKRWLLTQDGDLFAQCVGKAS